MLCSNRIALPRLDHLVSMSMHIGRQHGLEKMAEHYRLSYHEEQAEGARSLRGNFDVRFCTYTHTHRDRCNYKYKKMGRDTHAH